jgi:hypothetical protein
MKNEFANRQNMFLAIVALLAKPAHHAAWKGQSPTAFSAHAVTLIGLVKSLTTLISEQQAIITGYAEDKEREEQELETIAHEISAILADWFADQGREAEAAQAELSLRGWQRLRDVALIARAQLIHKLFKAALEENPDALAALGLTPEDATLLAKETKDFEDIVANPAAANSARKALTNALRPKFREVNDLIGKMDNLVLRFRKTEAGQTFAETWQATRIIRDLGQAAPQPPAPAPGA